MWQWIEVPSLLLLDVIMEKLRSSPEAGGGGLFSTFGEERLIFPSKDASFRSCIDVVGSNAWHLTMLIISSSLAKSSFSRVLEVTHVNCNPFPTCYFHKTRSFVLPVWLLWRHFNFIWHDLLKWERCALEQLAADCLFWVCFTTLFRAKILFQLPKMASIMFLRNQIFLIEFGKKIITKGKTSGLLLLSF